MELCASLLSLWAFYLFIYLFCLLASLFLFIQHAWYHALVEEQSSPFLLNTEWEAAPQKAPKSIFASFLQWGWSTLKVDTAHLKGLRSIFKFGMGACWNGFFSLTNKWLHNQTKFGKGMVQNLTNEWHLGLVAWLLFPLGQFFFLTYFFEKTKHLGTYQSKSQLVRIIEN